MKIGIMAVLKEVEVKLTPDGDLVEVWGIRGEINSYVSDPLDIVQDILNKPEKIYSYAKKCREIAEKMVELSDIDTSNIEQVKIVEIPEDEYSDFILNFERGEIRIEKVEFNTVEVATLKI